MIYRFFILILVVFSSSLTASVLEIYNDGAKYRYVPIDDYVGFAGGIQATCDGQSLSLLSADSCPEKQRLCKEINILKELEGQKEAVAQESMVLDQLVSISKPTDIDASKWIDTAQKIGKKKAELETKNKIIKERLQAQTDIFTKQATSQKAVMTQKRCTGDLELTIPAGYIGAKLLYEADTTDDSSISIIQYLALSNHSGIDIVAKEAFVYAKSFRLYLRPQHFTPWLASLYQSKKLSRSMGKSQKPVVQEAAMAYSNDMALGTPPPNMGAVVQTGYKNYHVSGIELPSTAEEIKVKIADYKAPVECEYISHPYRDSKLYRVCSFTPNGAIESNKWIIKNNKRVVSNQAYGEYRNGKYMLNVDVDDEVLIHRKNIIKRDQSSGIFGGSIRKKDGFELDITNISQRQKRVKIIDRIPSSITDKIKIKLLSINGDNKHELRKDGRISMSIVLGPKEHKKIKVLFELQYDKELKVQY